MASNNRLREPKACRSCAYAKVKCEPETADGCKRCLRLKRECVMQAPGAHKRKAHNSAPSDVARLEEKLDSMTAIFAASSSRRPLSTNTGGGWENQRDGQSPPPSTPFDEDIMPSDGEMRRRLTTFQTDMAPHFPFVVVPMDITVSELQQQKPFLFSTIIMVTCIEDATRQLAMVKKIREYIGSSIVIKGEQNLDLLQGLLVCLSWYHFQLPLGSQITSIIHMALAMLIDLGLHRKSGPRSKMVPNHLRDREKQNTYRTLEERRVYLGCFYVNSIVSMCLRDMAPMRYTDYTEQCCRVIEDAGEYPTDLYLVHLVRLHRMADRISRVLSFDECDPPGVIRSAPIGMCIKSLEAELQQFKQSLTPNGLLDSILLMHHYYSLEICLYEIALDDDFPTERYGNYPLARLNILYSCLTSTKAFFDMFFSIPARYYFNLPYTINAAYGHAIGILSKLLLFTGENWDREYAHSIIDIPTAIEILIGKIEGAVHVSHLEQPPYSVPEMFVKLLPRVRVWKEQHEAKRMALMNRALGVASDDIATFPGGDFIPDIAFQFPNDLSWECFLF